MTIAPIGSGMIGGMTNIDMLLAPRFGQPNIQVPQNMPVGGQTQQPMGGGVWGQGGRLITPEQAQRQRERAQELMAIDYSPISSPWQGVARVLGNVQGAMQERGVRKSEDRTSAHNQRLMEQIRSGASGGPDGMSPSSGPNIEALLLDRYASPEIKAYAQNALEQRQKRDMAQFQADVKNRETVWEDNSGNRWRMGEGGQPEAAPFFVDRTQKFDTQVVTDPTTGQQILQRVPVTNPYAQPQGAPAIGAVIADPRKQAGAVDSGLSSMDSSKTITRAQLQAIQSSLGPNGRAAADQWMQRQGIRVID